MSEKRIFRNIQHEPRIWGITFGHVFGTLIASLVLVMIGQSLEAGGLVTAVTGGGCAAGGYGLFFYLDNRDPSRGDQAKFVRPRLTSICLSNQGVVIAEEESGA